MKLALSKLYLAVPALGWGPLGWLTSFIVTRFTNFLYEETSLAISLEVIALKNESHRKTFDKAAITLKMIANEKGPDSKEYQEAKDAAKEAFRNLVSVAH